MSIDPDEDDRITICTECDAQFMPDEEGFDWETCIECGGDTIER